MTMSRGFGASSSPVKDSSKGLVANKHKTTIENMEASIQKEIDDFPGLREAMKLENDLFELNTILKVTPDGLTKEKYVQNVANIRLQLDEVLRNNGFDSINAVKKKLHEITWDSSASFRDSRHRTEAISVDMLKHVNEICEWTLVKNVDSNSNNQNEKSSATASASSSVSVMDVGCGTGMLLKYLTNKDKDKNKNYMIRNAIDESNVHGCDLSSEMIKIATAAYPMATFQQKDFMSYNSEDNAAVKYDRIIFNECLHNFESISATLIKANSLLKDSNEDEDNQATHLVKGRIIISHPKGFSSVSMQRSRNRLLVPNLLPTDVELNEIASQLNMKLIVAPSTKTKSYLAVLERK